MHVIEGQAHGGTQALDLGARWGLVARVHDAELRRKHRLGDQALHRVQ
jgi:hypothetical protein